MPREVVTCRGGRFGAEFIQDSTCGGRRDRKAGMKRGQLCFPRDDISLKVSNDVRLNIANIQ